VTTGVVRTLRACVAAIVALFCVFNIVSGQRGTLRVTFLDVGQGDATLIQTPSGAEVLVDGGKDSFILKRLSEQQQFFDRSLTAVIATHPDADHVGGLTDVVRRYSVQDVYYTKMNHDTPDVAAFEEALGKKSIAQKVLRAGDVLALDTDVSLHILHPTVVSSDGDTNASSVVARLVHRDISILLTGDAPTDVEHELVRLYGGQLQSTILKLGHHGSYTSTSDVFLGYVHPQYAIISRGCDNDYGHPHAEVLARLEEFHVPFLDTCVHGSITIESTGSTFNVIH
jgi:competence protein ComEC